MALTRHQIEQYNLINPYVLQEIPVICECGSEIMFTDTTRQIFCSNPRCTYKVASRLERMAKAMDVDGFGESNCIKFCKAYKMISPFQIFILNNRNDLDYIGVSAARKIMNNICDPEKRKVKLWEIVKYCGIPDIDGDAAKIFSGYSSMKEAFDEIENGEVAFIADKLGIRKTDASVMAVRIYNNLMQYKEELFFGEMQFTVMREAGETLRVAIHNGVYGFKNKGQFIKFLNNRYNGKMNFVMATSVSNDVDILISEAGIDNSGKVRNASRINARYIEEGLKAGKFTKNEIGRFKEPNDLHVVGEKILICSHDVAVERIDRYLKGREEA